MHFSKIGGRNSLWNKSFHWLRMNTFLAFASVAAKFDPNIERFLRGVSYRIFVSNLFHDIPLNNRSDSKKNMNEILSSFQLNIFFLKKGGGGVPSEKKTLVIVNIS